MKCKLVKGSHIKFQPNLTSEIWDMLKSPFMLLHKPGFVVDQCG
jgi:hypothetical protein